LLPDILRSARASLFPNNAPSTAPGLTPPGSDAELRALRKRCAASIAAALPRVVKQVYFGRGLGSATGTQQQPGTLNSPPADTTTTSTSQHNPGPPHPSSDPPPPLGDNPKAGSGSSSSTREAGSRRRRRRAATTAPTSTTNTTSATTTTPTTSINPAEEEQILAEIDASILDVFADAYCNKHLAYAVLELVVVRLMPELAEKGIAELWEERLS
jgi:hypothetical protein